MSLRTPEGRPGWRASRPWTMPGARVRESGTLTSPDGPGHGTVRSGADVAFRGTDARSGLPFVISPTADPRLACPPLTPRVLHRGGTVSQGPPDGGVRAVVADRGRQCGGSAAARVGERNVWVVVRPGPAGRPWRARSLTP